jgi:CBS domain-containing protein
MKAADLAVSLPVVRRDSTAAAAGRRVAETRSMGVVVADDTGHPVAVLSAIDLLRAILPPYLVDDPALARVYDDGALQDVWTQRSGGTVGALVDDQQIAMHPLGRVDADASLLEVAVEMVSQGSQIAVLSDQTPGDWTFVILPDVVAAIVEALEDGGGSAR